jgi:hypothetical protein
MKFDKEKWIAMYKKTVKDMGTKKATAGNVCAVASLRYLRDNMVDDVFGDKPLAQYTDEDNAELCMIKDFFNEGIEFFSKVEKAKWVNGAEAGFLSNASAAAKAAGFEGEEETLAAMKE